MNDKEPNKYNPKPTLKFFFIKLISIFIAGVLAINLIFNLIFSERLEKIDKILLLNKSESREEIKNKIRKELNDGLKNENLISEEDKLLLYKLYLKLKQEFEEIDESKL